MPNPLLRVTGRSKTNVDRPVALPPVLEHVEGQNFPYRGMYDHGVEPTEKPHDPSMYGVDPDHVDGHIVGLEAPEKEPEPIPVRLVQEFKQELRRFGSGRMTVDFTSLNNAANRAVELIGRSETRTSVKILNMDPTNILLVSQTREECSTMGYPVYPGKEHTLVGEDPVFVMAVNPTFGFLNATLSLAYHAEYRIREQ
jgi:hypothetical protein